MSFMLLMPVLHLAIFRDEAPCDTSIVWDVYYVVAVQNTTEAIKMDLVRG